MLTQKYLKARLDYDPKTGDFRWKTFDGSVVIGTIAGCTDYTNAGNYYRRIGIDKKLYCAHRLAFLYMTGEFPKDQVDHIDHNGLNNAWANLREVSVMENHRNRIKSSKNISGITGVSFHKKRKKWRASITIGGINIQLYWGINFEKACSCRTEAEKLYGFHPSHGKA